MAAQSIPTYNHIGLSDGTNVSYVAAGSPQNPPLLLLHGFPSSSNQFRNFIPLLASVYHVIVPDYPGFGLTTYPKDYKFTFDNISKTIEAFLTALNIKSYAVYIFDYGAPVGLRIAIRNPKSVKAIISQNGNAYNEGFGHPFWDGIMAIWKDNSTAHREAVRDSVLTLDGTTGQYTTGFPAKDLPLINPAAPYYDYLSNVAGKENQDRQLDLFYDYRTNVEKYPEFQAYFRKTQVPLLAVWGEGDPAFIPPGARAYKRDLPHAKIEFLDAGHFALETKGAVIAEKVKAFLKEIGYSKGS